MSDQKNDDAKSYSEQARIDAMDTEKFDAADYQKEGQGAPKAGLKADLEEEE